MMNPNTTNTLQTTRIGSLNCGGFSLSEEKRATVFEILKENKIDIAILQETNIKPEDEIKIQREWGGGPCIFSASHDSSPFSGVAILCAQSNTKIENPFYDNNGKVIAADITANNNQFRLINVHLPPTPISTTFEPAIAHIEPLMQTNKSIIIGGDFNFVENSQVDRHPPHQRNNTSINNIWNEFKTTYHITDIAQEQTPTQFTREMNNIFSRIDRFYTTPHITTQDPTVKHVGVSDHRLIFADFNFDKQQEKGKGRFKCNEKVHDSQEFLHEVQQTTMNLMQHQSYNTDTSQWWINYKKAIAKLYKKHAIIRIQNLQYEQKTIEEHIQNTETELHNNPLSAVHRERYQTAKTQLKNFLLTRTREKMIKARYNNFGTHYFQTKEFYRKYKKGKDDSTIHELTDDTNTTHKTAKDILNTAKKFYDQL